MASQLLAKLFSSPDINNMESLCKAINDLSTESADAAGAKAAELTRKNRDMFEKKTADIEAFLLHCSPAVGSAAMLAAIKAMFDTSQAKNYEQGADRAVELLKYYLDGGQLVAAHLRIVPEIVFPLVRSVGFYCLEKKNKPEIGQAIVKSALDQLFPADYPQKWVTSAHCALFACALRTRDFASVVRFINDEPEGVYNESNENAPTPTGDAQTSSSGSSCQGTSRSGVLGEVVRTAARAMRATSSSSLAPSPLNTSQGNAREGVSLLPVRIESKWLLMYLYYAAMVLIELEQYRRALVFLESVVGVPTNHPSDIQFVSYKKYALVCLLVHGYLIPITEKSPSLVRGLKSRMNEYQALLNVRFARGKNTALEVRKIQISMESTLNRDDNNALVERIIKEMYYKAVLAVAKIYSSINLVDIKDLANLASDDVSVQLIQELKDAGRLEATLDLDRGVVVWNEAKQKVEYEDVVAKSTKLREMQRLLEEKNIWLSAHPLLLSKGLRLGSLFNEDEGLSMSSSPIEQ